MVGEKRDGESTDKLGIAVSRSQDLRKARLYKRMWDEEQTQPHAPNIDASEKLATA